MKAPGSAGRNSPLPITRPVLLTIVCFSLPVLLPAMFGWLAGLLGIPVGYLLSVEEENGGSLSLRNGLLAVGAMSLLAGRLELYLFTLTLVPLGYTLYRCGRDGLDESRSGAYAAAVLAVCWIGFWILYGMFTGTRPYQHLLMLLDSGFAATHEMYMANGDIPVELQAEITTVIDSIRKLVPRILPGVLCCSLLVTAWMNQVLLNSLLRRRHPEKALWSEYSGWRLPEPLIWGLITSGILFLLGSGALKTAALNLLLVFVLIYFFQGLAVFLYLLNRWKIPGYLRVVLYFILIIQSYGLLLVAMLGVSDTWLNYRARKTKPPHTQD